MTTCSRMVFHSLQVGHRPNDLTNSDPHVSQMCIRAAPDPDVPMALRCDGLERPLRSPYDTTEVGALKSATFTDGGSSSSSSSSSSVSPFSALAARKPRAILNSSSALPCILEGVSPSLDAVQ